MCLCGRKYFWRKLSIGKLCNRKTPRENFLWSTKKLALNNNVRRRRRRRWEGEKVEGRKYRPGGWNYCSRNCPDTFVSDLFVCVNARQKNTAKHVNPFEIFKEERKIPGCKIKVVKFLAERKRPLAFLLLKKESFFFSHGNGEVLEFLFTRTCSRDKANLFFPILPGEPGGYIRITEDGQGKRNWSAPGGNHPWLVALTFIPPEDLEHLSAIPWTMCTTGLGGGGEERCTRTV